MSKELSKNIEAMKKSENYNVWNEDLGYWRNSNRKYPKFTTAKIILKKEYKGHHWAVEQL